MNRASERALERGKKQRAIETKLLAATVAESNAERELYVAQNHALVSADRFQEARKVRKALAEELAELSKD